MDVKRGRMVFLGYGKYWRSDRILGLTPIEQGRGPGQRTNVFIDGQFALSVDASVAARLRLEQEVDAATLARLAEADEQQRALDAAYTYLSYRPRSAREVLSKGDTRTFVVQAFDAPRRGVELALPGFARVAAAPTEETVSEEIKAVKPPPAKKKAAAKKAPAPPAKKKAAAPKAPAKKKVPVAKKPAATKKAVATKKAAAKKPAETKKQAATKKKAAATRRTSATKKKAPAQKA